MGKADKIPGEVKIIKVSLEVREELKRLKRRPYETYDRVIRRLLECYREHEWRRVKKLFGY